MRLPVQYRRHQLQESAYRLTGKFDVRRPIDRLLQSDALVAFRVVRIDNDSSAVIVWKLLKKYPIPMYLDTKLTKNND